MHHRNVFIAAPLLFVLAPLLLINAPPAPQNALSRLEAAEAAANRIATRFHQDLDFKGIFAGEFVTDTRLRSRGIALDEEEKWKQFDVATQERVYVAAMTFLHLWAEYMMEIGRAHV